MLIFSNCFVTNIRVLFIVLSMTLYSTCAISFVNEPVDGVGQLNDDNQAKDGLNQMNRWLFADIFNTSKHVSYWLYTRKEPKGRMLNRSDPNMVESSTYDASHPIKIIVHGWLGVTQEKEGLCTCTVSSYLEAGDYNVICVDWKRHSTDVTYAVARKRAKLVGVDIANTVQRITKNFTEGFEKVHLLGYSMGAHVVGFAGKNLADPKVPRITGLDPAKPSYENSEPKDRLDINDAKFVDIIHTGGDDLGIFKPLGHIDFYPNGGRSQPGCDDKNKLSITKLGTGYCSHSKVYRYYARSIRFKNDYVATECSSWEDYEANRCGKYADSTYMGEHVNKTKSGIYFLRALTEDSCTAKKATNFIQAKAIRF